MTTSPKTMIGAAIGLIGIIVGAAFLLSHRPSRPVDTTPDGLAARTILDRCSNRPKPERNDCYQEAIQARLTEVGVGGAMGLLKAMARAEPEVERAGHVFAHGIGIDGYWAAQEVAGPFGQCTIDFASGCNHGVIQAYLESQDAVDSAAVNALCAPYRTAGDSRFHLFQCVHGMGHGFQMMYAGDLPKALGSCGLLADGWDRESCYGGAFMENIIHEIAPHHPATKLVESHHHEPEGAPPFKALDSTDLLYPCSIMEPKFRRPCYEIQTSAILHFTQNDIAKTAEACATAPEDMQPICFVSLGRDISSRARRDPAKAIRYCKRGGDDHVGWCYFGVAKALIDWGADPSAGIALCGRLGDSPGWELCYQGVGEQVANLIPDRDQRIRVCEQAERPEAVKVCRTSAATLPPETFRTDTLKS